MVQKEEMYQENQGGVAGGGASPVERKDKSYWWVIAIIGIAVAIVATVLIF